jgi:hypothetical protein
MPSKVIIIKIGIMFFHNLWYLSFAIPVNNFSTGDRNFTFTTKCGKTALNSSLKPIYRIKCKIAKPAMLHLCADGCTKIPKLKPLLRF